MELVAMLASLFWSFMEQGGSKLTQLIVQLVLARLVAPEVFGALAILLVFTQIADSIAQSGMGTALIQRDGAGPREYSTAFWLSLLIAAIMYAVLFLAAPAIEVFYSINGLAFPLRILSLTFVFNSVNSIQRSYLQKSMNFRTLCQANVLAMILSGIVGIVAAIGGLDIWALVVQYVAQAVISCVTLFWFSPWRPSIEFDSLAAGELFSYGWKICVTAILNTLYTSVSELILGRTCSASDLGLYSQGRKWPNTGLQLFSNSLQNVFLPTFSRLQNDSEGLRVAMRRMLAVGSYVVIPVACFATVAAEPIVGLLLGDAWLDAAPVFACACFGNVFLILQIVNLRSFMALGRSDLYLGLQVIKVLFGGIVTAMTAILTGNIVTVAVANLVIGLLNVLLVDLAPAYRVHGLSRWTQLRIIFPILSIALVSSLCSTFFGWLIRACYIVELFVQLTTFAIPYIVLSICLHIDGANECIVAAKRIYKKRY